MHADAAVDEQVQALHELFRSVPMHDELTKYIAEGTVSPIVTKDKSKELLFREAQCIQWPN